MLSGLEARALCQYLGPDVRYKENFISSFLISTLTISYCFESGTCSTLINFLHLMLSAEMSWVHRELEWLSDPIWSHIRVLVTLWPFMPILMWFVVIPEPSCPLIHLCYSDLIKTRSHLSPSPSVRHLDSPRIFVTIKYPEYREKHCCAAMFPGP